MRALELILVLSVTVANVLAPPPPPPPPPMPIDPEQPPPEGPGGPPPIPPQFPTGGCEPDYSCPSTYETAVSGDNPCQAAQDFKDCTEQAQSFCTGDVPSHVVALSEAALRAVEDKCDTAKTYPTCANMCLSYENNGEADWADSKPQSGCDQYQRYLTCLQNFENSGSCKVTSFLDQANTRYNEQCQRTCSEVYENCNTNLPRLAADNSKLQDTCLLWSACKVYDFSKCQQTLKLNYDTKCQPQETTSERQPPRTENSKIKQVENGENGVAGSVNSLGLVIALLSVLVL